ncbi:MAG: aminodeoxychorismate synthase component I [Dehalogenimonas sp.]
MPMFPIIPRTRTSLFQKRLPYIQKVASNLKPVDVFARLRNERGCFFLDSSLVDNRLGRFSFIGCRPFLVVEDFSRKTTMQGNAGSNQRWHNPFDKLWRACSTFGIARDKYPVPFIGGAVGYFGYDSMRYLEKLPTKIEDDVNIPDFRFGLYDVVYAHDHLENQSYIISSGFPELEESARLKRAKSRLCELNDLLLNSPTPLSPLEPVFPEPHVKSNFTQGSYLSAVNRARQYIIAGDIFEVNLSQRFEITSTMDPYALYCRLREINRSPFAAYLDCNDFQIVSSSPERFLKLQGARVETRPIKGTRPRGCSPEEDKSLSGELLASEKDRAENMMIVDLSRNDLGRVCLYGTIKVTELAVLETYPTVFHLTSTVTGELMDNYKWNDLFKAAFPGGSVTGAPKIRAMEIIDELEPTRRSVYTGAIGYVGFNGDLDFNIAIRTILTKADRAYFQVGGAITFDSDPQAEYEETLYKSRALFKALGIDFEKQTSNYNR